jgi:hypothetical protein
MKRTIFYSWQSEHPSSLCRNVIQASLEAALKKLGKDDSTEITPVLDRDTGGVPGSPSISDKIFEKIVLADVFVADVSLSRRTAEWRLLGFTLTHRSKTRRTPNPNVLLELGYAVAILGWDRIILVQNTEYGGPDDLPFDLRGRRTVTFALGAHNTADEKSERKRALASQLDVAIRSALLPLYEGWRKPERWEPRWWGFWNSGDGSGASGGQLLIAQSSARAFSFHLQTFNGSHLGQVNGFAEFTSRYAAEANIQESWNEGEVCRLRFRISDKDPTHMEVEEVSGCQNFHGMGARFDGRFTRRREALFDLGFMNELELQKLFTITGQYYEPMMDRFAGCGKHEWGDTDISGLAFFGLVRGLGTIMEGILMKGTRGELWAAYIDDERVRYFTTEPAYKHHLPKTIEAWRSRFREKEVLFMDYVSTIHNEYGGLEDIPSAGV